MENINIYITFCKRVEEIFGWICSYKYNNPVLLNGWV